MKKKEKFNMEELLKYYKKYLAQGKQKLVTSGSYIGAFHDDSGGHPNYHCDQHDNTPSRIVVKKHK